jgi:hypothetical protein
VNEEQKHKFSCSNPRKCLRVLVWFALASVANVFLMCCCKCVCVLVWFALEDVTENTRVDVRSSRAEAILLVEFKLE